MGWRSARVLEPRSNPGDLLRPQQLGQQAFRFPSRGSDDPEPTHRITWPTVKVCLTTGAFTSTSSLLAVPGFGSMNSAWRNAWRARAAAS